MSDSSPTSEALLPEDTTTMTDDSPTQEHSVPLPRETCLICHEDSYLPELLALGCSHIYHPECITKCQLEKLLDTVPDRYERLIRLIEAICNNQASLRSLLDPTDGTDRSDYDTWQLLDRQEKADKGKFYYCRTDRPRPSAAARASVRESGHRMTVYREQTETEVVEDDGGAKTTTPIYQHHLRQRARVTRAELAYACDMDDLAHLDLVVFGRGGAAYRLWYEMELRGLKQRKDELSRYGERPMLGAPTLYFDWLCAFERLWYRTRAMDIQWEMAAAAEQQPQKTEQERAAEVGGLRQELDDLMVEHSDRVVCLVRVRESMTAEWELMKQREEIQQPV
ncbi:hypothetical protein PG994_010745 [Apiospora phragmitis]|uniref:RING-type domain-containing protein n=1 Tax=Apiospora phragmitis TaxID=2905665 RepID=A0ABR1TQT4_9PEZI